MAGDRPPVGAAVSELDNRGITTRDILTDKAIENAMVIHAAFGGSTNFTAHSGHPTRRAARSRTLNTGRASTAGCRAW
ncbi:MAG: dihydroxy-acid dehydratase [Enterobacter hormaechei]